MKTQIHTVHDLISVLEGWRTWPIENVALGTLVVASHVFVLYLIYKMVKS